MTTPGPPQHNQPPERPQGAPAGLPPQGVPQGAPAGLPAVVTDSLLRQSARFSAIIGVVLYGLGGVHALHSTFRFPTRLTMPETLFTAVVLLSMAAVLGLGVHRSRRAGDTLPVLAAGLLSIAVLSGYWLLGGVHVAFQDSPLAYALFIAPLLVAVGLAALAWLTEQVQGPPTRQVSGIPADPYPLVSTVFAVVLYGVVCLLAAVMYILLDDGLNFDLVPAEPAPTNVLLGTLGLCLPFPLLVIGLSASLSGRARSTAPIFVAAVLAALIVLASVPQATVELTDAWPLCWALAPLLAAPLFWPILRSWQGIPTPQRQSWLGL